MEQEGGNAHRGARLRILGRAAAGKIVKLSQESHLMIPHTFDLDADHFFRVASNGDGSPAGWGLETAAGTVLWQSKPGPKDFKEIGPGGWWPEPSWARLATGGFVHVGCWAYTDDPGADARRQLQFVVGDN